MRILLVEHDVSLGSFLEKEFAAEKISVDFVADSERAKALVAKREYEAAIVDLDLPKGDGLQLIGHLAAQRKRMPILTLGASFRTSVRADALNLGADDFLAKPFGFSDVLASVRNLVNGGKRRPDNVLRFENLELSRDLHMVTRAGRQIRLTPKEFALLEYLLANAGQRVTRSEIAQNVWHHSGETLTNIIDVYVNYLRKKVDVPFEPKLIHTVRGVGYQLAARNSSGRVA
jgi:two-component system, OmpR family, copper resistance phosphate regulon response regulator CusR